MSIQIYLNGKKESIEENFTILELLNTKKIRPEIVVVELNGEIVERNKYAQISLQNGDKIETVFYMGGGEKNESR